MVSIQDNYFIPRKTFKKAGLRLQYNNFKPVLEKHRINTLMSLFDIDEHIKILLYHIGQRYRTNNVTKARHRVTIDPYSNFTFHYGVLLLVQLVPNPLDYQYPEPHFQKVVPH